MKKLLLKIGCAILVGAAISPLLAVFVPEKAHAATPQADFSSSDVTAVWVNRITIKVTISGTEYTFLDEGGLGDDKNYKFQIQDSDCHGEISGFDDNAFLTQEVAGKDVSFDIDYRIPDGECANIDGNNFKKKINSPENAMISFRWASKTQIQTVDGAPGWDFTDDTSTDDLYFSRGTENGCTDKLLVTNNREKAVFFELDSEGTGDDAPPDAKAPGCKMFIDLKDGSTSPQTNNPPSLIPTKLGSMENSDQAEADFIGNGGSSQDDSSCESKSGAMGWITCPIIVALDGALNWVDTQIQALLEVGEDKYNNQTLKQAWAQIRNIAYILLIPTMLIMVIGTALGFEVFNAYTIKKALPRMIAAVIFITLSWYITAFLIGFVNVIGGGVLGLMTSPFGIDGNMNLATLFSSSGASGVVSSGIQIVGASAMLAALGVVLLTPGGAVILMLYLGTALLFVIAAFLVLLLRQMLLIVLILAAPIAILAWIFPGNDKPWKLWWDAFWRLLIMFPLIMAIIGAGRIFAFTINETPGGGLEGSVLTPILKLTAYVLPYAFIPFTFKFAGGLMATFSGAINDKEKGLLDRTKNARAKRAPDFKRNLKAGATVGNNKFSKGLGRLGSGVAAGPKGWAKPGGIAASRETAFTMGGAEVFENNEVAKANQNNDQFLLAGASKAAAQKRLAKAQEGLANAATDDERQQARQEIAGWNQAIALAGQVPSSNVQRLAFAQKLAATGYQLDTGQEGYNELAGIMAQATGSTAKKDVNGNTIGVSGPNAGIYANAMNGAQYALKGAGRFDLAGINGGTGYDAEAGLGKADPYTLATRAKPDSIKQKAKMVEQYWDEALVAKNAGDTVTYTQKMQQAEIHKQELGVIAQSATGKNRDVALDTLSDLTGSDPPAQPVPLQQNASPAEQSKHQQATEKYNKKVQKRNSLAAGRQESASWLSSDENKSYVNNHARGSSRRPDPVELEEGQ